MINLKSIVADMGLVSSLKLLVQTYEEQAVGKIQKVRDDVLRNRDFIEGLSSVYGEIKSAYSKKLNKLSGENKSQFITGTNNGKSISVLLSSDAHFSGDIIRKVFDDFYQSQKESDSGVVIVGSVGYQLWQQHKSKKQVKYFTLKQINENPEDLREFIKLLMSYAKVTIFYGKFINLVSQNSSSLNLGEVFSDQIKSQKAGKEKYYLFEPSLEEIISFFENEIVINLFKRNLQENDLAKLGSRIKAMESASQNIELYLKKLNKKRIYIEKLEKNRKLRQQYSGMLLWH